MESMEYKNLPVCVHLGLSISSNLKIVEISKIAEFGNTTKSIKEEALLVSTRIPLLIPTGDTYCLADDSRQLGQEICYGKFTHTLAFVAQDDLPEQTIQDVIDANVLLSNRAFNDPKGIATLAFKNKERLINQLCKEYKQGRHMSALELLKDLLGEGSKSPSVIGRAKHEIFSPVEEDLVVDETDIDPWDVFAGRKDIPSAEDIIESLRKINTEAMQRFIELHQDPDVDFDDLWEKVEGYLNKHQGRSGH